MCVMPEVHQVVISKGHKMLIRMRNCITSRPDTDLQWQVLVGSFDRYQGEVRVLGTGHNIQFLGIT